MAHHCKAFIVYCMDFRIQKAMREFLEKENLMGDCDVISIAGGVKQADFVMSQLDISVGLHGATDVILSNHTDCGAYGGSENFASPEEERMFHVNEMEKARNTILAKNPNLNVRMILGTINGENISLEEIKQSEAEQIVN